MSGFIGALIGPRVPPEERSRRPLRYLTPTLIFMLARVVLLVSIFVPYWHMELVAPQYPDGLFLTAYCNHLTGDVREIDGLNHYIGMRPLGEAAAFERAASVWMIIAMFLLVEGAAFVHSKWAVLLAIPAITFPLGFILDLYYWMRSFGLNLDPDAPLSSSVKPFVPTVIGEGGIGQFRTYAAFGAGYWLACLAAGLIIVGFFFHRRAYRPLTLRARAEAKG
ncbi:MAG TPA: cytochrome C [Phycisphaerales bacterium]|nr:cytochrome C [Phycisphaerales bacterium]